MENYTEKTIKLFCETVVGARYEFALKSFNDLIELMDFNFSENDDAILSYEHFAKEDDEYNFNYFFKKIGVYRKESIMIGRSVNERKEKLVFLYIQLSEECIIKKIDYEIIAN